MDIATNYYGNVLTGSGTRNGESGRPWRGFNEYRIQARDIGRYLDAYGRKVDVSPPMGLAL